MLIFGLERCSIFQQVVGDISMTTSNGFMKCVPDPCSCLHQFLCKSSVASGNRTLERNF